MFLCCSLSFSPVVLRLPWNFQDAFWCAWGEKIKHISFLYMLYVWVMFNCSANLLHVFFMLICCFIFSGVWLLVWEWVHALCLYPLSIWECWTLWEKLSWAFCGWRTGSNSWMVSFLLFSFVYFMILARFRYMWILDFIIVDCFWIPCLYWVFLSVYHTISRVKHQTYKTN